MAGRLQGGALRLPGRLWSSWWAAPGHGSGRSGGRPDGPPVGRAEGHGPDAWQRPGSSRAVRCASLGRLWPSGWAPGRGSGQSGGRSDGPPPSLVECHKPDAWQRPGSSRAVRCGSLGGSGRADGRAPGHGSRRSGGQPDRPQAGRLAGAGRLQGGALRRPGRLWPRGWAAPGPAPSRQEDGQTAHQRATGRTPGRGQAAPARCAVPPWGGSGVAYVSRSDTISAPRSPSNPPTSADFVRLLAVHRVLIYRTRRISHNKIR